ncbi:hypothetical protein ACTFPQ_25020 [Bacillus cereus group sp. MYBK5-1]|uniref:hypothetical protein n=1 Tax=Bacillus cereus group TaxID=86661 RepID=UPI000BF2C95E|nr:hypothetical protein [Bacillus cereus]PEQ56967.1 hypothetical protein CN469_25650 [Bacillus cereus]
MYKIFNLRVDGDYSGYHDIGLNLYRLQKKNIEDDLKHYFMRESLEVLDANSIENEWFPSIEASIFISHSHLDEAKAIGLAGWLYSEFGLKSFIDSGLWGHSNELLKYLDENYCLQDNGKYNYQQRNLTTSHVYMILSISLMKMIDKCEAFFFINSNNALDYSINKYVDGSFTQSPWIYNELSIVDKIRVSPPERYNFVNFKKSSKKDLEILNEAQNIKIAYEVTGALKKMIPLHEEHLGLWMKNYKEKCKECRFNRGESWHPLDVLYAQHEN